MNAAGIDVSSSKSTVAVLRPFGEVIKLPFDVPHSAEELASLAEQLKSIEATLLIVAQLHFFRSPFCELYLTRPKYQKKTVCFGGSESVSKYYVYVEMSFDKFVKPYSRGLREQYWLKQMLILQGHTSS